MSTKAAAFAALALAHGAPVPPPAAQPVDRGGPSSSPLAAGADGLMAPAHETERRLDYSGIEHIPSHNVFMARDNPAEGDPLSLESGYLGGPVVAAAEKVDGEPAEPAHPTQYMVMDGISGAKYNAAGVETVFDFATAGRVGQATTNPTINAINRFHQLDKDNKADYHNLDNGGRIPAPLGLDAVALPVEAAAEAAATTTTAAANAVSANAAHAAAATTTTTVANAAAAAHAAVAAAATPALTPELPASPFQAHDASWGEGAHAVEEEVSEAVEEAEEDVSEAFGARQGSERGDAAGSSP